MRAQGNRRPDLKRNWSPIESAFPRGKGWNDWRGENHRS